MFDPRLLLTTVGFIAGRGTHRMNAWNKAGGVNRQKHSLESFDIDADAAI